jgi:hypothetical protein
LDVETRIKAVVVVVERQPFGLPAGIHDWCREREAACTRTNEWNRQEINERNNRTVD